MGRSISFVSIFLCLLLHGCGTLPNGRGWGQDATLTPGWERIKRAAYNAAAAPETWVPAAGALAFYASHADRDITEWAVRNNPVYGSRRRAEHASEWLLNTAEAAYFATAIAAPSGEEWDDWLTSKAKGIAVGVGAVSATTGTTAILKNATGRLRPDGSNDKSFPSGTTSRTAVYATLASRNLDYLGLTDGVVKGSQIGLGIVTAATAWARVEAERHYPSDVLAGAALGHFLGSFITDAFLGVENPLHLSVMVEPSRDDILVGVRFSF